MHRETNNIESIHIRIETWIKVYDNDAIISSSGTISKISSNVSEGTFRARSTNTENHFR